MQVHLVDGTYELFRAFYGAPPAKAPDGREVGATKGILRTLVLLLRTKGVTHVGVAFDQVIESFRNDLFPGYKTSEGIEPALWAQFPLAEQAAAALGLVVWPMVEFEADDALASACARARADARVERVVLCSPDKDLAQCVEDQRVVLWDRRRDIVLDADGVREKYGVSPASIPDLLALVGDTADGIPGIPRWGMRSAAAVLARYQTIEAIPADPHKWAIKVRGAEALSESLEARRDEAALYRTLATLRRDAPLAEDVDALEWRGADRERLAALAKEIGDDSIERRVEDIRTREP